MNIPENQIGARHKLKLEHLGDCKCTTVLNQYERSRVEAWTWHYEGNTMGYTKKHLMHCIDKILTWYKSIALVHFCCFGCSYCSSSTSIASESTSLSSTTIVSGLMPLSVDGGLTFSFEESVDFMYKDYTFGTPLL